MTQDLKTLLDRINDLQAESKVDLGAVNPKVRVGVEGRMRAAMEDLPAAEREYIDAVASGAILIAISGDKEKVLEFGKKASEFGTLVVDFRQTLSRILGDIKTRGAGGQGFGNTEYYIALNKIQELSSEIGALGISTPELEQGMLGPDLVGKLDSLIRKYYGNELDSALTRLAIGKAALKVSYAGKRAAVVLLNCESVNGAFLPSLSETIELGPRDEVSQETVEKVLLKIKNKVSKKNKTQE